MAKEFKDWVDEFVDNGANPKDVTNWPENAGGGSTVVANPTLVGTEATLRGLQVDGAKYKVPQGPNIITVAFIDRLTDEQCSSLRCGDIVIQDTFVNKEAFIVARVSPNSPKPTIILFHQEPWGSGSNRIDCQSVVYQLDNEQWSCVANEFFNLQTPLNVVFLEDDSGNIPLVDFQTICEKGYCFIDGGTDGVMAICSGSTDYEGEPVPVLSTAVYQGKYYTVTFEPVASEEEFTFNYTVNTETIGGGSSAHYAYLKCYDRDGNRHDLTFLCENASISTYDELAKYLINYGFTEGEISSGEYSNIGLPVTDTGYHPVFSMQASANTSSGETTYNIYCYELVISSGEIIRNEIYIDSNNDFSIYHLT